jgi:tRNA modification GTPase
MKDTITAISTPLGEGAIGIIRLSGPESFAIGDRIFHDRQNLPFSRRDNYRLYHGFIKEPQTEEILDEVLITGMKGPGTYTGEDMLEINAHGGILVVQRILELTLQEGARLAEPGEFTKRAFLNGKMDLAQAEAVADLIRARTDLAKRCALQQLEGGLSQKLKQISSDLLDLLAELEAHIDFPEEELPHQLYENDIKRTQAAINVLQEMLQSARYGKAIREGVRVAIIGKPNAGKSSLLNRFLEEPRAIVTATPGTTRDTITESVSIEGIPFLFTDTAGIRETSDPIEQEGVRRTEVAIAKADMVLMVMDSSNPLDDQDKDVLETLKKYTPSACIGILNKSDLPSSQADNKEYLLSIFKVLLPLSALTGEGMKELKKAIIEIVKQGEVAETGGELILTNVRHAELMEKTVSDLQRVKESLDSNFSPELVSADLREALHHLGEITGQSFTGDLLNRIFSRFCIGK